VTLDRRLFDAFRSRRTDALFVNELRAALNGNVSPDVLDGTLRELASAGAICIVDHTPPDHHLEGHDLRIVAVVGSTYAASLESAEEHWRRWLAQFLASHRCS